MASLGAEIQRIVENYRYAYPSARARAMKSLLLTRAQKKKIAESKDLQAALYLLRDTVYGPALSDAKNTLAVEIALKEDLAKTMNKIGSFLPGRAQSVFKLYLARFEAENIRSILIGIQAGLPKEERLKHLIPIHLDLKADSYEKMAQSKTIGEAASTLSETIYQEPLARGIAEYEKTGLLTPLDSALGTMIYDRIFSRIGTAGGSDTTSLKKMIGIEIDIANIKSILRLINASTPPGDTLKYLIPRGYRLDLKKLEELSKAASVEEIVAKLKSSYYGASLSSTYSKHDTSKKEVLLNALEQTLDDFKAEVGRSFDRGFPLGIGPILGYVIVKTAEVRKLVTVLKLKDEGFTSDEIEGVVGKI